MRSIAREADFIRAMNVLRQFMNLDQWRFFADLCNGPEGTHYTDKAIAYANRITTMPATYDTDGQGDDAIVNLHYFRGGCDWYVIEKDAEPEQHQAFGWCDLGMGCPELGYVSIEELKKVGAELDLHWEPKALREVKRG